MYDALALDLDGTLVDTAPDIAAALASALQAEGFDAFPLRRVRGWIGDGPDVLIARALAAQGRAAEPALARRLRARFDAETLAEPLRHGRVFPGLAPVLAQLADALPLAVVTNKPTPLARAVLQAAGLLAHCHAVLGADEPALRKPAPALLHEAARRLGLPSAASLLMVGDGDADLRAAAAAGAGAALVAWGYGGAVPTPGVWHVAAPHELLALLPGRRAAAGGRAARG